MTTRFLPRLVLVLALFVFVWGAVFTAALLFTEARAQTPKKRLLVVTVTKGFRHKDSIPVAEETIQKLGEQSGLFTVDYVRTDEEMAQKMTAANLANFDGVFFVSTTGDLPLPEREAFLQWIRDGHAFIGAHAATDTFHGYKPYIEMIGGEFATHGPQLEVQCLVRDKKHASTKHLGRAFKVYDEIYQHKNYDPATFQTLIYLNQKPVKDGTPGYYPIAWTKSYGKGRVFYTALGHRPDVWQAPWYQQHVLGGIKDALGVK